MRLILLAIFATLMSVCGACLTRTGAKGRCINIRKCGPVMKILNTRPPFKVYDELKREHCGFEGNDPKICCELRTAGRYPKRFVIGDKDRYRARSTTTTTTTTSTTTTTTESPSPSPPSPVAEATRHPNLKLLDHELCGNVRPEFKIYGGNKTKLFEFPWMALLSFDSGENDGQPDFRCGATIINEKYLLTAAHCVSNLPDNLKLVSVRVGDHNLAKERDCEIYDNGAAYICAEKHQDFGIESVYPHPDYAYDGTLQNDIALVRIKGTMNFRPASVRPICLPIDTDSRNPSSSGLVTGWGSTSDDSSSTNDVLLKVKLPIMPFSECEKFYRGHPFVKLDGNRQICAGGQDGKDSCSGDSGGPLQSVAFYRGTPRMVQQGIVSFGKTKCGMEGMPGVYTGVKHYVDWILDNMRA